MFFLAFQLLDRWHLAFSDRNNNDSVVIVNSSATWLLASFSHGVLEQTVVASRSVLDAQFISNSHIKIFELMVIPTQIDGGMFFWFTQRNTTLAILVVHCENSSKGLFPRANQLLEAASGCENVRTDVARWEQTEDLVTSEILELDVPIRGLDLDDMWIECCEHKGVIGIGIGTNKNKRQRAAWLALALSFDLTHLASTDSLWLKYYRLAREENLGRACGTCSFLSTKDGWDMRSKRCGRSRSPPQRSRVMKSNVSSLTPANKKPSTALASERIPSKWDPFSSEISEEIRNENKEQVQKNTAFIFLKQCKEEFYRSINITESREGICLVKRITTYDFPWTCFIAALSDSQLRADVIGSGIKNVSVCLDYGSVQALTTAMPFFILHYVDETHASLHVQVEGEKLNVHCQPIKHIKPFCRGFLPRTQEVDATVQHVCVECGKEFNKQDWIHRASYFADAFVKRQGLLSIQLNMHPSAAGNAYTLSQEYVNILCDFMLGETLWSREAIV